MAVQAERHCQIRIMGFSVNVVFLKQSIQQVGGNALCFEPVAGDSGQRLQTGITAEEAEVAAAEAILPVCVASRSASRVSISHAAPPFNTR